MAEGLNTQIITALIQSYSSTDDATLKASQQFLTQCALEPQLYFQALVQIIASDDPQVNANLKNAAGIQIRSIIKSQADKDALQHQDRVLLASGVLGLLQREGLADNVRNSLGYALIPLLSLDSTDSMGTCVSQLTPDIYRMLQGSVVQIDAAFKAIRAAFSGLQNSSFLLQFFRELTAQLIVVGEWACGRLEAGIAQSDQQGAFEGAGVLFEWGTTFLAIVEHFEISAKESLREIAMNDQLASLFSRIISVPVPDPSFPEPTLIPVIEGQLSTRINRFKTHALQALNLILQEISESKKQMLEQNANHEVTTLIGTGMPDSPFTRVGDLIGPQLLSSLMYVTYNERIFANLADENTSFLVLETLLLLHKMSSEINYHHIFQRSYQQIILHICMPLLSCSPRDLETFEISPSEFVNSSLDICESQESDTPKSCAALLLQSLCLHIDGALSFTFNFSCQLFDSTLVGGELQQYQQLLENPECYALKSSMEVKMDISIMTLCVISQSIGKRYDLLQSFEMLLTKHFALINQITSPLVKCRIGLILYLFIESLYLEDDDKFKELLYLVLQYVRDQENPAVNYQGCSTLTYIFQEDDVMYRTMPFVQSYLQYIIEIIPWQNNKNFYDALQEIIQIWTKLAIPHIQVLIQNLMQKITGEMAKSTRAKPSVILVKCWNVIRSLVDYADFPIEELTGFEATIAPLLRCIQQPSEIDFDDDIILFEIMIMKKLRTVTDIGWEIVPYLPLVQQKYSGNFIHLFQALNYYIFYGSQALAERQDCLRTFIDMSNTCMYATLKERNNESGNLEGVLLYHTLLILYSGTQTLDQVLSVILENTFARLKVGVQYEFFKVRLLGVVLCALYYNAQLTCDILSRMGGEVGYLTATIREVTSNALKFGLHAYDKKVATLGLCALIVNCPTYTEVSPVLNLLLGTLIGILSLNEGLQTDLDSYTAKLLANDPEDEEFSNVLSVMGKKIDMKQSQFPLQNQEAEANMAVGALESPIKEIDEYKYFKEVLRNLQQHSPQYFAQLMSLLQQQEKESLARIVRSNRVELGRIPGESTDVRRIVAVKMRNRNN